MILSSPDLIVDGERAAAARPRLGFLGVGWIGYQRMLSIHEADVAELALAADPAPENLVRACQSVPSLQLCASLEELLESGLDGLVIATPSAQHAEQSRQALEQGVAVFCQKPLGRTAAEVRQVVEAARAADRLLGVDLSYRHTQALQAIRALVQGGELGTIFAVDLTFHNAYGPQPAWFYQPRESGGGCVMDLGIHLVDAALWILEQPITAVESRLFHQGRRLSGRAEFCEDYATARLELASGAEVRLACSWKLHAGQDAVIEATFYGTRGGARLSNVGGSFTDFRAERFTGTARQTLCEPPDAWGGGAATAWARQLAEGGGYDPEIERLLPVAEALDAIYAGAERS